MDLILYRKKTQWGRYLLSLMLSLLLVSNGLATPFVQDVRVTGRVTSASDGQGIPGVNVVVKGTQTGTITDVDGRYSVSAPASAVLVFSSIGFEIQEITIGGRSVIDVTMQASLSQLDEVVVTALGFEREEKSLGYSVGRVSGDEMRQVPQESLLSSLAGRVAGVTINQTSGAGSSINVVIRGASSLTTDNQPLFVVDGVPMQNGLNNISEFGDGNQVDYGNAISDINPDDIESISVLKGPSAAALYGTRAGNGVILITTKSGAKSKALGVSFSTSTVFENATRLLDLHYRFANGQRESTFAPTQAYWGGPELDVGNMAVQWNSPLDENGNPIPTPLRSYPNAMKDFLQTGITSTNNVSVSGGNDKSTFRVSYSNMLNRDMIPGANLYRNGLSTSASFSILDNLTINANVNIGRTNSDNRPSTGDRRANPLESVYASSYIDYNEMRNYWVPGQEGIEQLKQDNHDNPHFLAHELRNGFIRDRVYGNISLRYDFTKKLSVTVRHSLDQMNERRETKIPFSYSRMARGGYYLTDILSQETNSDVLATYKDKVGELDFSVSAGGNLMHNEISRARVGTGDNRNNGLVTPDVYNVQNIPLDNIKVENLLFGRAIYSVYAMASIGFKDQIYLDLTARNDWSSTLPPDNNDYFYPSASLSWLANYTFDLPQNISLLKFRGGWAKVGNDTGPHNLYPVLDPSAYNTLNTLIVPAGLKNPTLKPEEATSIEGGIDLNLFNDRLRFTGTYYTLDNENQIFSVRLPESSGYSSRFINAGLIRSRGWEFTLGGTPLQKNGWTWTVDLNWSTNKTTVEKLADNLEFITFWSENGGGAITKLGEEVGNLYSEGYAYVKDPNSDYYRWPVLSSTGEYIRTPGMDNMRHVGNFNPDFIMGMQTGVTFKRFSLNASFDWRQGGEFMSFTYRYAESDWKSQRQLDNMVPGGLYSEGELVELLKSNPSKYIIPHAGNYPRVGGHTAETGGMPLGDGGHDGTFIPGVIQIAGDDTPDDFSDDVYEEHLGGPGTFIHPTTNQYPWNFNEQITFDASFIKLRELSIGYRIPDVSVFRNATFSVFTRNIMLWTKADIGIDPERAFWANGGTQGNSGSQFRQGIERQNVYPWSVSYGFKLNFNL